MRVNELFQGHPVALFFICVFKIIATVFVAYYVAEIIKTYIKCKYKHQKDSYDESTEMYTKDDRRYDVRDRFK
jgi:hypothetical protein